MNWREEVNVRHSNCGCNYNKWLPMACRMNLKPNTIGPQMMSACTRKASEPTMTSRKSLALKKDYSCQVVNGIK